MWLLHASGSVASILSIFGFQIKSNSTKSDPLNQIINYFASVFYEYRCYISIAIVLIPLVFIFNWLNKIKDLNNGIPIHISGREFYKKNRETIVKGLFSSKCPAEGCSGHLIVTTAPSNQEGIKIIGRCNKRPNLHTYDFDAETLQGKWVKLTDKPKPNNNQTQR